MTRKVAQDHAAQRWFAKSFLDQLRSEQIQMLLVQQQKQIALLARLLARPRDPDSGR
jgi:hypothetical protein